MDPDRLVHWMRRGAYILLGLAAAFWLFMGVGEMAGGDLSGVSHPVPAALAVGLLYVAAKSPLAGGLCLAAVGLGLLLPGDEPAGGQTRGRRDRGRAVPGSRAAVARCSCIEPPGASWRESRLRQGQAAVTVRVSEVNGGSYHVRHTNWRSHALL